MAWLGMELDISHGVRRDAVFCLLHPDTWKTGELSALSVSQKFGNAVGMIFSPSLTAVTDTVWIARLACLRATELGFFVFSIIPFPDHLSIPTTLSSLALQQSKAQCDFSRLYGKWEGKACKKELFSLPRPQNTLPGLCFVLFSVSLSY